MKQKYYDGDHVYYTYNAGAEGIRAGILSALSNSAGRFSYQLTIAGGQKITRIREQHLTKRLVTAKKRAIKLIAKRKVHAERVMQTCKNAIERCDDLVVAVEKTLG